MDNLFNNFDKHLTNHIIKVNYLLENNWEFNDYGNYWYHKSFTKEYMPDIDGFHMALPHLYSSTEEDCKCYSLEEAYKTQYKKNNRANSQQLELQFEDNEDFDIALYEELNAIYGAID
jgi:hypothetical protein